MDKRELFEQWKAAFEAKDWKREGELWLAMGGLPITPGLRALAKALHDLPVEAINPDSAAIRALAVKVHNLPV